jgi:hypothetical protein
MDNSDVIIATNLFCGGALVKAIARILLLTLVPLEAVWAVDESFSKVLHQIQFDSSGSVNEWLGSVVAGAMVVALGLILALYFFRHRDAGRKCKWNAGRKCTLPPEISEQKRRRKFREQAQRLGFTRAEARILSQIVGNGEAEHSERLLKKGPRFWHFAARVKKLARQRKHELAVLDEIVAKLSRIRERNVKERKDLRSEIDLPVWLGSEDEGQVEGQLVDISLGGAAIRADMDLQHGDQVEFWSMDTQWLPQITAVVLHAAGSGNKRIFNLQFAAAPAGELRKAIVKLQKSASKIVGPMREQPA